MSKNMKKDKILVVHEIETIKNYEYSVKIMRRLLQVVGMWPLTSPTYPNILRLFLIFTAFLLLMLFIIPIGLYTLVVVKEFKERLRNFGPFIFGAMNTMKFATLVLRSNDFRECLNWISDDWRMTKKRAENDLMLASARTGVTFATICATFMLGGGMSYGTFFSFIQERTTFNNVSVKPFAYPVYFGFFEPYDHFYKVYALYTLCGYVAFTVSPAVACTAIGLTMHVCGQISVISYELTNLASGNFDKEIFRSIIEKHLRALRLAKKLENLLSGICLVEMMGCCFNICATGYYVITEFKVDNPGPYTYCVLIVSFTFNIFTYCYIGEQLTSQCNSIGNVVYNIDWYHLSPKDARSLLMIITSTNRPVILTAGKMTILSMQSFSHVLKAALTYLNMLRTVTHI